MTDKLFFDTDCISAFLWVKEENILFKLYPNRVVLPKQVFDELSNPSIPSHKEESKWIVFKRWGFYERNINQYWWV